jgi:hypothetical protein
MDDLLVLKIQKYRKLVQKYQAKLDEHLNMLLGEDLSEDEVGDFNDFRELIITKLREYPDRSMPDMHYARIKAKNAYKAKILLKKLDLPKVRYGGHMSSDDIACIDYGADFTDDETILLAKFGCRFKQTELDYYR